MVVGRVLERVLVIAEEQSWRRVFALPSYDEAVVLVLTWLQGSMEFPKVQMRAQMAVAAGD